MSDLSINLTTARRFILGRQGLWPGRRWQGLAGTAQPTAWWGYIERRVSREEAQQRLDKLHTAGAVSVVEVEDWNEPLYALAADVPTDDCHPADQWSMAGDTCPGGR